MKTYIAANGVPFTFKMDFENPENPTIEVYDARYPHTPNGQLVAEYYYYDVDAMDTGICLDGGVPEWTIDRATWLAMVADAGREKWNNSLNSAKN